MSQNTDRLNDAFTELEKARRNDDGRLAMHARLIANAARDVAEAAEAIVMDRIDDPWPKLPELKPITTQLTKV